MNLATGRTLHRAVSPATLLATILLVFGSAATVIALARYTGEVAGVWVSNAVLLAVLMKHRRRDWLLIAGAGFIANVTADLLNYSLPLATLFAFLNLLEVFAVALPLRLLRLDRDFTRPGALLAFYALAIGPAPLLGAVLCAAFFHWTHGAPLISTALNWYSADALGLVIVVPPLMTVRRSALEAMFRKDQIFWTSMLVGIVAATIAVNYFAYNYPIAFLFFPAVLLLTFQRGFEGGTIGLAMSAAYLIVPAILGHSGGPLGAHPVREQVTIAQIFIAVMGFSVVLVGAALEERKRLEQWLASAMKRAETAREEAIVAKDSAEKASRSKSMFLATMSHELRTPLNAVIGFSELMYGEVYGPLGDKRYREYAQVIEGAGKHLLDLINDVLDMSKIEAGKHELNREELAVSEFVDDALEIVREQASAGHVTLRNAVSPTPLYVMADRRAVKQILLNLLSNAIKFTPKEGTVSVEARGADGLVTIAVRDTGVGIPADQIYRLGNPFVQVRNNAGISQNGTGLGLALVRGLVELHGGKFKIESVEGRGTAVSVALPLARKESLAA